MITIFPDADLKNADWTKQTVDVYISVGDTRRVVENLDELSEVTGISKSKLRKMPVGKAVLKKMKEEEEDEE